ncbi:hypothetical protein ACWERI_35260 [Streptomyces collinus]
MDQGIAAVLAGVAGLVGAGIGGLTTAYGARVGAQKSIEAVQVQVDRQAASEHEHWVRDQRKQVCNDIATAWTAFFYTSAPCMGNVASRQPVTDEQLTALDTAYQAVAVACHQLIMWGPDDLTVSAELLSRACLGINSNARIWPQILTSAQESAISGHMAAAEEASRALSSALARYVTKARATLTAPY